MVHQDLNLEPTDCLLVIDSKWFQRLPDWLSRQFEAVLGSVVSKNASKKFCPASGPSKMPSVVTENVVRRLGQPQCAALVTSDWTRAPNNDAAGGRCVPRTGKKFSCRDRTEEGASRAGQPHASLSTRSISLDISSVAGLRSGSAAFMGRSPFCHGKRLAGVPIRKLILRGFGCGVRFASGRESHRSTRALGPS